MLELTIATYPLFLICAVGYVAAVGCYRLLFHPLAHFPGPKLAALTKWYEFYYDVIKGHGGQYAFRIHGMHEQYGPIIRINPEELHIQDPKYYPVLYAGVPARRNKYGPAARMAGAPLGTFGTEEHDVHRRRRAADSILFSKRSISKARPLIQEQAGLLCQRLREHQQAKTVVELHTAFLACTTDSVSKFTFGKSAGLQGNDKKMNEWRRTMIAVPKVTPLVKQFPWAINVAKRIPLSWLSLVMPDLARLLRLHKEMHIEARGFLKNVEEDKIPTQRPEQRPTLFEVICNSSLPTEEKTLDRLAEEAFVVIAAGGDTVARALTIAMYYLLSNPVYQDRLRDELTEAEFHFDEPRDWARLHDNLFLSAVIRETLRLSAIVTSRLPQIAPDELRYGEWVIPDKTPVSLTIHDVLMDSSVFPDPEDFLPNRWIEGDHINAELNKYFVPFSKGLRMCLGIDFAYEQLYYIISVLVLQFDFELFETSYDRDIKIVRDCFLGEPDPSSEGVRVLVKEIR